MLVKPYLHFALSTGSWSGKAPEIKWSDNPVTFLRNPEQGITKSLAVMPDMNYKSLTIPATLIQSFYHIWT